MKPTDYDIVIIGAGLAGLTLSYQLLRETDKTVLLLDRRADVPGPKQKVGESLVQVGGYYFGKTLDLEEYLFREHYMKYNLRFYWKTPGKENDRFEDYSQSYIRTFSNIPCYQLDRNTLETELLRRCRADERLSFEAPATQLRVDLSETEAHTVAYRRGDIEVTATATWVVDTSGRSKVLARKMDLAQDNAVDHGASFLWVDGLVDIDKLTDLSPKALRLKRDRSSTGHLPVWLATNHFMGEGLWFWVIPLQGKTSLGLVYDNAAVSRDRVSTPEALLDWVCETFPLFEKELRGRKVLDHGSFKSFSYGCALTINKARWAMSGESGRFADPLYSPGSDFIALHNTLIIDAIVSDEEDLEAKCGLHELLMRSIYESLLPTYAASYDALGDQEAFTLKYTWELSVYFGFFVFPFINDLIVDRRFLASFYRHFSALGPINSGLQKFISDYYQWKKAHGRLPKDPVFHDFTRVGALRTAEKAFYSVGVTVEEAREVLARQTDNLLELARYIVAHVTSVVLGKKEALRNRAFVESIDLGNLVFDPEQMAQGYGAYETSPGHYEWAFDPDALNGFHEAEEPLDDVASAAEIAKSIAG